MIVNPQLFNYKLAVGTLVIACTALASFSYYNYTTSEEKQNFLIQEKKLLENQISEIISSHDNLNITNEVLSNELEVTKSIVDQTNDSMKSLRANLSLIDTYKARLSNLRTQQQNLIKEGDSFSEANKELLKQNEAITNILEEQLQLIDQLQDENRLLDQNLKNAAQVTANSFKAKAYTLKNSGEALEVVKATKTDNIRVDFVLAENHLASEESKELYIQIIGPDNNIVADKGAIKFDKSSLIYSSKVNILYTTDNTEVTADILTDERLEPGRYYVSVYEKNRRLGGTQFILN